MENMTFFFNKESQQFIRVFRIFFMFQNDARHLQREMKTANIFHFFRA